MMLLSMFTNIKNSLVLGEFKNYSETSIALCFLFFFHNVVGIHYMLYLLRVYLPMCSRNMHSVEWLQIKSLYEKA